jgi:hypothetical protein
MPTPGLDGRFSGGGATKLLTPVANGPVTWESPYPGGRTTLPDLLAVAET